MVGAFFDGLRRLSLGIALVAIAGAVLLLLDLQSRKGARSSGAGTPIPRIAFVQHASIKAIDDGRIGAVEQLKQRGYIDGVTVSIKYFNAEGDIGTANAIAKEVTSGTYDFILTMSTPSLQTVASANKSAGQIKHIFGLVTDPYAAGVGIDREDHLKHPPYMTGMGSMQPVESILRYIQEMRPQARRIGLVWNPAESNSAAQTLLARSVCKELSLELIEGSVENTAAVQEATNSVLSRGVDCMWISGDITVSSANTLVIRSARNAGVPVFCSLPSAVLLGSTLDLGADYITIGRNLGDMAADVLGGKSPSEIPVENRTDEILLYNETTLSKLKERWIITPAIRKRANGWITETEKNIPAHLLPSK